MARKPQRPVRKPTTGSLTDRVRSRLTGEPVTSPARRRRVPRYEIEARRQRMVRTGIAALAVVVVLILAGAFIWTNLILPRQTVASVGGVDITREEYWKVRAVDLWNQASQFQQFAEMVDPNMATQYQQLAAQTISQIPDVWGSTELDSATLSRMIDDQVFVQSLDELGLTMTEDEVETFLLNQFADPTAPLLTPTPTPTFTPDRAAMATGTALALVATPLATPGTPAAAATPVADAPQASPVASPLASPVMATPWASPLPTVSPEQARIIAESNLAMSAGPLFDAARLSRDDYERLVAAPALARAKVEGAIAAEVGQSAAQVHAAHILVDTQELARELWEQLQNGADLAALAREHSIDEATAPNGGDLGWFTRSEMVDPFAEAAFSLEPGQTSEPVQSEFGWHIIRVLERDDDHPLTDQQITRVVQNRVGQWLEERQAALGVSSSLPPTPTPAPAPFEPPVAAPPPPTPTPAPVATPVATPVSSPVPAATP